MHCQLSKTAVTPFAREDSARGSGLSREPSRPQRALAQRPPQGRGVARRSLVWLAGFVAALLTMSGWSNAVSAQATDARLQARLVAAEQLLGGGILGEARVLDLKAHIESLPFVARGDRKQARAANEQGLKWFDAGQYDRAVSAFERGLALDAADQEIGNNLAFAYFRAGKMTQAWQAMKRTLALAPARTSAWANIGQMRAAEGDPAVSAWSFENSYRFSRKPKLTLAYFEKLKAETDDAILRAALSSALSEIASGTVENLIEHPRPIGGSLSGIAEHESPDEHGDAADDDLFALYERVRAGDKAAFDPIQSAANEGRRVAQAMLGEAYRRGYAVVEDAALSATWYQRAAEQGHSLAKYQLGLAYQEGHGVAQDYKMAARWYAEAAALGDRDAMNNLGAIYSRGQIGRADAAQAAKLFRQASDLGNPQAAYNLAIAYAEGDGVPRDLVESARLYRLSAESGFVQAQLQVADNYENGRGVERDEAQALHWYRKAAAAGVEYARDVLKRKGVAD